MKEWFFKFINSQGDRIFFMSISFWIGIFLIWIGLYIIGMPEESLHDLGVGTLGGGIALVSNIGGAANNRMRSPKDETITK